MVPHQKRALERRIGLENKWSCCFKILFWLFGLDSFRDWDFSSDFLIVFHVNAQSNREQV